MAIAIAAGTGTVSTITAAGGDTGFRVQRPVTAPGPDLVGRALAQNRGVGYDLTP